jgi:hypothetical protein
MGKRGTAPSKCVFVLVFGRKRKGGGRMGKIADWIDEYIGLVVMVGLFVFITGVAMAMYAPASRRLEQYRCENSDYLKTHAESCDQVLRKS